MKNKPLPRPKFSDPNCVRCGRDRSSARFCNHIHRCLGRLIDKSDRAAKAMYDETMRTP